MTKTIFLALFITVSLKTYAIDGVLIKTIDYSFTEKWNKTLGSDVPKIVNCDVVYPGQDFYMTAIVSGYKINRYDSADVFYSIKITRPDSSTYFSQDDILLFHRKIINKDNLQMGDNVLKINFRNKDVFGTYKIEIEIVDKVAHQRKKIQSMILLTKLPPYNKTTVTSDDKFEKWFDTYYEDPKPEQALAYFLYFAKSGLSEKESSFWPVFAGFLEITKKNDFLYSQILDCYKSEDLKTKIYLLYLLIYSKIGREDFYAGLKGDEKAVYLKIKNDVPVDIYGRITSGSQLDMLWATFMAGGSYKPIYKLIQTLDYQKYEGGLDKYKTSKKTEEDKQNAVNNAIYNSLIWSLKSNCIQHPLVLAYCRWAFQNENLTTVEKDELKKIIGE